MSFWRGGAISDQRELTALSYAAWRRSVGRGIVGCVIEGTAGLVTDQATRHAAANAFEQAYGWHFTREDGTWYQLGDAIRTRSVQLYRVQPDKAFAFGTGSESSQTRYRWDG